MGEFRSLASSDCSRLSEMKCVREARFVHDCSGKYHEEMRVVLRVRNVGSKWSSSWKIFLQLSRNTKSNLGYKSLHLHNITISQSVNIKTVSFA